MRLRTVHVRTSERRLENSSFLLCSRVYKPEKERKIKDIAFHSIPKVSGLVGKN